MTVYHNREGIENGIRGSVSAIEEDVYKETDTQSSRPRMVLGLLAGLCLLFLVLAVYYTWP